MKIKKIKVSNFRNLKKVDINFGNINILTGKNSTGKTNLTQLLTNCLNTNDIVKDFFGENITTYGPGIDETTIETTIFDFKSIFQTKSGKEVKITKPTEFIFKNKISKKTLSSQEHSIDYIGLEYIKNDGEFIHDFDNLKNIIEDENTPNIIKKSVYKKIFTNIRDNIVNNDLNEDKLLGYEYYDQFTRVVGKSIINRDNNTSFSACLSEIYSFITKTYDLDKYKDVVKRINEGGKVINKKQDFIEAGFINILADIQANEKVFKKFNDDLNYFTQGILRKVEINTIGAKGFRGDIFIETPHGPNELQYISSGSAIILYFVAIKNWLELDFDETYYIPPSIMIFDELDSAIHPSLISRFSELLKIISSKIQLFITTHSVTFIDCFEKKDVYLLKDMGSFGEKAKIESNILSYKTIIDNLSNEEKEVFGETDNSELYINGFIDNLFPITLEKGVKIS